MSTTVITYPGPPTAGFFSFDDVVIDSNAATWLCTSGGTPGTWVAGDGSDAQYELTANKGIAGGYAGLNASGLIQKVERPTFPYTDPTLIDGDDFRGADGFITARNTFGGVTYIDGHAPSTVSSVISGEKLVLGANGGTWPPASSAASYTVAQLGSKVTHDLQGVSFKISSKSVTGGTATTDGGAAGQINTSNPDGQTTGDQMVFHGAVHMTIGKTNYSAGIFDSVHTSGLIPFTQNGVNVGGFFINPLAYDTLYTMWMLRVGDRILIMLPGNNGYIWTDHDPRIPLLWGPNIVIEPFYAAANTDHAIEYHSWTAHRGGTNELLSVAFDQSVPRDTSGKMPSGFLPKELIPYFNWSLSLPGVAGTYVSTPDSVATSITGDLEIDMGLLPASTRPAAVQTLLSKWVAGAPGFSYLLTLDVSGKLILEWSADGTTGLAVASTVALPSPQATRIDVKATLQVNDGSGNHVVKFWTSADSGVTWTQLGSTVTTAGVTSIFDSTASVQIGCYNNGLTAFYTGVVYSATIRSGIGGSVVASWQANGLNTYTAPTTEVWTLNGPLAAIWDWLGIATSITSAADVAQLATTTQRATGLLLPSGAIAETFPRDNIGSSALSLAAATGKIVASAIPLIAGKPISNLTVLMGNTAVNVPTNWWFGLFDSAGHLLALTADQLTAASGTLNAYKTLPIATIASGASATYTPTANGLGYIGVMFAATTGPNLGGVSIGSTGAAGLVPQPAAIGSTGGLTTPPAFPYTVAFAAGGTTTRFHAYLS